jgi:hypothetical protein
MTTKEIIALVIVIVVVLGLNLYPILRARRGISFRGFSREVEMFQTIARRARQPWQQEDEDLEELGRLVAELRGKGPDPEPAGDADKKG